MEFWARRPFTRNLVGSVLVAACWGAFVLLDRAFLPEIAWPWSWAVRCGELLAAVVLVTRLYDRMPAAWTGLGGHRWAVREMLTGLALGTAMAVVASLPPTLIGGTSSGTPSDGAYTFHLILYFLFAAAFEELLFRGYFYQRLTEMIGVVAATLVASVGFALMHLGRPEMTLWAFLNIALAGIFFSLCYLRSGSLWLPIAAHAVWNIVLAVLFGLPVSGIGHGPGVLGVPTVGPEIVTGGAFGPEGGIAATIMLVAGSYLVGATSVVTFSPYTYARIFEGFRRRRRPMEKGAGSS